VHFVASDAHNTKRRPLRLQPAYDAVSKQFGEEKARALFIDNPLAAFEGRDLPHVPEIPDEKSPATPQEISFLLRCVPDRQGCRGKPAQAFKSPKTSRTTSSASRVVRHQWSGANGSLGVARTITRRPVESFLHNVCTLRVCALVVTIITVFAFDRSSSAVITLNSSIVLLIAGSSMRIAFDGTPSCIKTRELKKVLAYVSDMHFLE